MLVVLKLKFWWKALEMVNSKTLILEIVFTKECIVDINGGCMQFMPNQTIYIYI